MSLFSLESLDGLKEAIISLGERFDKDDEATALINEIQAKELEVQEKAASLEDTDVLVLFAAPGSTMIATSKSYIGSLVELCWRKKVLLKIIVHHLLLIIKKI